MPDALLWSFSKGAARTLKSRLTLNNGEAMRDMAIEGLGLAILPGVTTRKMPIVALWLPIAPMPGRLRVFVDHLVAELDRARPWQLSPNDSPARP